MMKAKMQHCFWCGAELGVYEHHAQLDGPEACGERECQRELMAELRDQEEARRMRAEEDHFERY
jgi:predicted RNA-binding Zn-ribbon protein involved in translation (DUF1610 family)